MMRAKRKGLSSIYLFFMLVAMTLFCSLGVDYGRVQVTKLELSRAADAGARAAAAGLPGDTASATQRAIDFAKLNLANGAAVEVASSDIQFGTWNKTTRTFTTSSAANANAVQVTARRTAATNNAVQLVWASIFGAASCDVNATVVAVNDLGPNGYGVIGIDSISMDGNARVDSYISTEGPYTVGTARSNGNVASNGNITLSGSAVINGSAWATESKNVTGSKISGDINTLSSPLAYPAPDAGIAVTSNDNLTLNSYVDKKGNFKATGNKTIVIPQGTYYFNDFSAAGGVILDASHGAVTIYVAGDFSLAGGSDAYQEKATNLKIVMLSAGTTAKLTGDTAIYADLYAPFSAIEISGTADFYGQMVGKTINMPGDAAIHYDESMSGQTRHVMTVK